VSTGYSKGLHPVADGVWAYLQPDGGWGWSNAGLVTSGGASLLIDTLFDLRLTREMLDQMAEVTPAAREIDSVVNTHANGDHCYGNALVANARIVASKACAEEMADLPPARLADLMRSAPDLGQLGAFVGRIFGPFEFDGVELVVPNDTFEGELELRVGDRTVRLIEVGPAHTAGDVVAYVPDQGIVFTGDILFHGGHPIVWAGPVSNWIDACDRVLALGAETVVPGHGPLAGPRAVEDLKGYFELLTSEARMRYDAGMDFLSAARDVELGPYAEWGEAERLAVNVHALYRDFGAHFDDEDPLGMLRAMAELSTPIR
jgi:cyclase